MKIKWVL